MRAELLLLAVLAGCGPPDAPKDLDALTRFLYREWDQPTPTVMEDGVNELERQLAKIDVAGALDNRSFRVTALARDDLDGVPWPMNRDPGNAIGACVARRSQWPVEDQVSLILQPDQIEAEPTAKAYTRRFVDPVDPACFVGQGCPILRTENDITRENAVLSLRYVLHKHLRWVRLDETRWAVAARSYIDRAWPGDRAGTAMQQSYSVDLLLGQADGRTLRYQCSWSENDFGFAVDDGLALAVLVDAANRTLEASDSVIAKRFHAE